MEAALVVAWHRRTGKGVAPADFLLNLASGLFLMIALRCALASAGWVWIALSITAALIAHLADLRRRWKR